MTHIYNEDELVKGCKAQLPRYQKSLYNQYYQTMFGICLRYAKSSSDAQDYLQESFIKVFKYMHTFREEGSLEGWIRKIVVRTCIEQYKKSLRMPTITLSYEHGKEIAPEVLSSLSCDEIVRLISTLPKGYKTIFNLYVIEGYTHHEISQMLGISVGTSKSQLSRAKVLLQKRFEALQVVTKKKEHERERDIQRFASGGIQAV